MLNLLLLGTGGSIGKQSVEIIKEFKNKVSLQGFSVGKDVSFVDNLIKEFPIKRISFEFKRDYKKYKEIYKNIECIYSSNSVLSLVQKCEFDICINALSGFNGFLPSIEVLKKDKTLCLANKESLVVGGEFINTLLADGHGRLVPIDSEHVAISKCLENEKVSDVDHIVLTASGGPFFDTKKEDFKNITLKQALNHPTWSMGKKITIDSSTMMNKCFEVIEAYYLFGFDYNKIQIKVDRKSFVHSYVCFKDGKVKANVGKATMLVPIRYALAKALNEDIDLSDIEVNNLENYGLKNMDYDKFSLLKYSTFVIEQKGDAGAVLNAANEEAVNLFLNGSVNYVDIEKLIDKIMNKYHFRKNVSIRDIVSIDKKVRKAVDYLVTKGNY
jgi:1-deoxy-D-xylulose-5-phosphate reductoisomerase